MIVSYPIVSYRILSYQIGSDRTRSFIVSCVESHQIVLIQIVPTVLYLTIKVLFESSSVWPSFESVFSWKNTSSPSAETTTLLSTSGWGTPRGGKKQRLFTYINDGPLLHHDGVVSRGSCVGLALAPLLEDEDAFHRLRHHICGEEGRDIQP